MATRTTMRLGMASDETRPAVAYITSNIVPSDTCMQLVRNTLCFQGNETRISNCTVLM